MTSETHVDTDSQASPDSFFQTFAKDYMKTMHAPGMTVGRASGSIQEVFAFGYSDLASHTPVETSQPFWIGSIGKSLAAITALQLYDEGKLDLDQPVLEILPDLPIRNRFGAITTHHLLTHTSGLPNWLGLFSESSTEWAEQAYAPGVKFAYCNLAFDLLGFLIAHLDGRSWPDAVTARVLQPLGMGNSSGRIDYSIQSRMPTGYQYQNRLRGDVVSYPLVPAGIVLMTNAAGSIAASAEDMNRYMQMIASGGVGPRGRLISSKAFELFSKPHVKAPIFSPTSSYGYGIGVDEINGHKVVRHTGGTTNFASAILVDLDDGVGAFASINAMQGYRPTAIVQYAVDTLRAKRDQSSVPAPPKVQDPLIAADTGDYTGEYQSAKGHAVTVTAENNRLVANVGTLQTVLNPIGPDIFDVKDVAPFGSAAEGCVAHFEREDDPKKAKGSVVGLSVGANWYVNSRYQGPKSFPAFPKASRYTGTFASDSPWYGATKIVERKGQLWLAGLMPLKPSGERRFSVEGGEGTLGIEFFHLLEGRYHALRMNGEVLRRVEV